MFKAHVSQETEGTMRQGRARLAREQRGGRLPWQAAEGENLVLGGSIDQGTRIVRVTEAALEEARASQVPKPTEVSLYLGILSVVVVGLARHVHGARGGVVLVRFAQGQNRRVSGQYRANLCCSCGDLWLRTWKGGVPGGM